MSDNIKLVIEIPKKALELLNTTGVDWLDAEHILSAVAHGIPLDDVKAEIKKKCDRINDSIASELSYPHHREIQELLCEIIASIGKVESEE